MGILSYHSPAPGAAQSGRAPRRDLGSLLHQHLALFPDQPPQSSAGREALLRAQCQARLPHHCRVVALTVLAFTLLWWPTDRWVFAGQPLNLPPMTLWRIIISTVTIAALLPSRLLERRPLLIFLPAMYLCCGVMGYTTGRLGGIETPFAHLGYVMAFGTVPLPLPLRARALATAGLGMSTVLGLQLAAPLLLAAPSTRLMLSFWLFALMLSVVTGHLLFVLSGQNFLQALEIRRHSAELSHSNTRLEERVAESTRDLRALLAHQESAREEERARISRDLHDDLGQELSALRYALGLLRRRYERQPTRIAPNLDDLETRLARIGESTRHIVADLRPRVLDDLGLGAALQWLVQPQAADQMPRCALALDGLETVLAEDVRTVVFRIAQEALNNARRHASARAVAMELRLLPPLLLLRVSDDGVGFDPAAPRRGMGLIGMRERALSLGGSLHIHSEPGAGVTLELRLPLGEVAS